MIVTFGDQPPVFARPKESSALPYPHDCEFEEHARRKLKYTNVLQLSCLPRRVMGGRPTRPPPLTPCLAPTASRASRFTLPPRIMPSPVFLLTPTAPFKASPSRGTLGRLMCPSAVEPLRYANVTGAWAGALSLSTAEMFLGRAHS